MMNFLNELYPFTLWIFGACVLGVFITLIQLFKSFIRFSSSAMNTLAPLENIAKNTETLSIKAEAIAKTYQRIENQLATLFHRLHLLHFLFHCLPLKRRRRS